MQFDAAHEEKLCLTFLTAWLQKENAGSGSCRAWNPKLTFLTPLESYSDHCQKKCVRILPIYFSFKASYHPDPLIHPLPNLDTLPVRSTWKDITNHPQFVRMWPYEYPEAALCLFLYPNGMGQITSTDRSTSNGTVSRSRFRTLTSCRFCIDTNTMVSLVSDTFNLSPQKCFV